MMGMCQKHQTGWNLSATGSKPLAEPAIGCPAFVVVQLPPIAAAGGTFCCSCGKSRSRNGKSVSNSDGTEKMV